MAVRKVTYVEPSDYFTPEMRRRAREFDKKEKEKKKAEKKKQGR